MNILLGPGDGLTALTLDLNSAVGTYAVLSLDASPARVGERSRVISLMLNVTAASQTALLGAVRAVETMLNQASSGRRPSGVTAGVVLSVRVDESAEWVYFDVLRARLGYPSSVLEVLYGLYLDIPLELECLPYGRGDAITDAAVTVTGDDPVFTRAAIPGDVPALVEYTITDQSTASQYLNRIRIAHRSLADLDDGDFAGYYNAVPISPATSGALATAYGDDIATLASGSVSAGTWQDVAYVTTPTAYADNAGLFDIWARVTDANAPIGPPGLASVTATTGGSLTVGATYQCCVTAIDGSGNESLPSTIIGRFISNATNDALSYVYVAPGTGTAASYRCYFKRDANAWQYKTDAAPNFVLTAESGATSADPPSTTATPQAQFRAQVSLESGTTRLTLLPVTSVLANGSAEWLYLGAAYVPPMAVQEGGSARQGRVTIQTNSPTAVTILVDCVALLPGDEQQCVASYGSLNEPTGLSLAALRKHVIATDRHGRDIGLLLNTGDDSEEGQLSVLGPCYAGPGDTTFVPLMETQGGVANIANMSLSVQLRLTPRYRFLAGGTP